MGEATDKITANDDDDRSMTIQHHESYIAVGSTDDTEAPEQLRAQIEDTRAEMSQTINEIQERLSPENVMDQVKEKVREATVGKVERVMERVGDTLGEVTEPAREVMGRAGSAIKEGGRSAVDVVYRNPIPVALIGLGLGMLAMRAFRGGNGYDYADTSRSRYRTRRQSLTGTETEYDEAEYGGTGYGRTGYGRGYGREYTSTGGGLNRVKETASELAHRSTDALSNLGTKASHLGTTVKDTASSLGTRCERMFRENPLAVGVVAVAAGTAVGLMLPTTRFENEYIGETSDKLVDKAQEVARDAIDKVQDAAQQMTGDQQQQRPGA
jgi:ElaB/YqjD/DUF883 family membrane-anchored ribosome-binding protein